MNWLFYLLLTFSSPSAAPGELPACAVEDGSSGPLPCMWDASKQGNGEGMSYIVLTHPDNKLTGRKL